MSRPVFPRQMKHYLIGVEDGLYPSVVGPFDTPEVCLQKAIELRSKQSDTDALFWASVNSDGALDVGYYLHCELVGKDFLWTPS